MRELAVRANTAAKEFLKYMGSLIEERRMKPGRDMLSIMIHAQKEGRVSPAELIANVHLVVTAGHITTVDQLSNSVHTLLTHPEQLQLLKEDPSLMKSAVEELLRYSPAVPFMHRIAAEDFELRGRTIRRELHPGPLRAGDGPGCIVRAPAGPAPGRRAAGARQVPQPGLPRVRRAARSLVSRGGGWARWGACSSGAPDARVPLPRER